MWLSVCISIRPCASQRGYILTSLLVKKDYLALGIDSHRFHPISRSILPPETRISFGSRLLSRSFTHPQGGLWLQQVSHHCMYTSLIETHDVAQLLPPAGSRRRHLASSWCNYPELRPNEEAEPCAHSVMTAGRRPCACHSVETVINPNSQKQTSRDLVLRCKTSWGLLDEVDAYTNALASPSRQ